MPGVNCIFPGVSDGLMDAPRQHPGAQVLTAEQIELVCQLKKDVPERSRDRMISIAEGTKKVEPGVLRRSTVHRALKAHGLSARKAGVPDAKDLDCFEADAVNLIWHSDMLVGPWLPDPEKPGKMRRAYLYAVLDDHSRRLVYGRFSFKGDLPAMELVLRRAFQRCGLRRRLYYDNAAVYRSRHMQQIVATLGIQRIVYTRPYRPMGNGKQEALNRLIRSAFIAELKASQITTLDALNEAFLAWADTWHNRRCHAETGATPMDRRQVGRDRVRYVDDEGLRQAFLWKERRTSDKAGVFSLFGVRHQAGPEIARRRIEIRYDPVVLWEVEVWHDGEFVQRARPLQILSQRRPRVADPEPGAAEASAEPCVDWLGHLVQRRQRRASSSPRRGHSPTRLGSAGPRPTRPCWRSCSTASTTMLSSPTPCAPGWRPTDPSIPTTPQSCSTTCSTTASAPISTVRIAKSRRPFVVCRSHDARSQRTSGVWTEY